MNATAKDTYYKFCYPWILSSVQKIHPNMYANQWKTQEEKEIFTLNKQSTLKPTKAMQGKEVWNIEQKWVYSIEQTENWPISCKYMRHLTSLTDNTNKFSNKYYSGTQCPSRNQEWKRDQLLLATAPQLQQILLQNNQLQVTTPLEVQLNMPTELKKQIARCQGLTYVKCSPQFKLITN